MAEFKALDPNVEVNGETVHAVVDGMGAFKESALKILAAHGIADVRAGRWYKQQAWLDAFKSISQQVGNGTLFDLGLKVPERAKLLPDISTLGKALPAIDITYHMSHRNGEIGHYYFRRIADKTVEIVCDNPYPCDFDRGIITAFCNRFPPKGTTVKARVTHDDSRPCRKQGADSCTYLMNW